MGKFNIIAPRDLRNEILTCLEPVPRSISIWFRELKPSEVQKYPPDIEIDRGHPIYLVGMQYDSTATREEVSLLEGRLRTKWPYVRAEQEPSL